MEKIIKPVEGPKTKKRDIAKFFRFLSLFLGFGTASLVGSSFLYFLDFNYGAAIYLVILASIAAKFAEWFSFNGSRF